MEEPQEKIEPQSDGYTFEGHDEFEAAARELRALQSKLQAYGSAASTLRDIGQSLKSISEELAALPARLQTAVDQNSSAIGEIRVLQGSLGEKAKAFDQVASRLAQFDFATPISTLQQSAVGIDAKLVAMYQKFEGRLRQLESGNTDLRKSATHLEGLVEKQSLLLHAIGEQIASDGKKGLWGKLVGK